MILPLLIAAVLFVTIPGQAAAQATAAPDPREAQPERPTVATHAFTVSRGYFELETGFQRQSEGLLSNYLAVPMLLKVGLGSHVQLDIAPGWQRNADNGKAMSGLTDMLVGVKWRVADRMPLLGAFAIQTTVALPIGSTEAGTGTGEVALNLLAISSHSIGPVALDLNLGYTRRGGDGSVKPKNEAIWTVSTGFPVYAKLGMVAEIFGVPGTSGPAGSPPVVAFLTGPTYAVTRRLVIDAGAIINITGFGNTAIYGGLTWNIGTPFRRK